MAELIKWNAFVGIALIAWGLSPWYRYIFRKQRGGKKREIASDIFESVALVGGGIGFLFGKFSFV